MSAQPNVSRIMPELFGNSPSLAGFRTGSAWCGPGHAADAIQSGWGSPFSLKKAGL